MLNLTGVPALDLAIGLALIYFLLSTLAATVQEFVAAIFGLRARTLEQGLRSMLEDPKEGWTYVDKFYDHPLIKSLYREKTSVFKAAKEKERASSKQAQQTNSKQAPPATSTAEQQAKSTTEQEPNSTEEPQANSTAKQEPNGTGERQPPGLGRNSDAATRGRLRRAAGFFKRTGGPSYISPRSFALVVLDSFAPAAGQTTFFDDAEAAVAELPEALQKRLEPMVASAQTDVERLRTHLEAWFDDTMARVSGWYKRKTQIILIVIGIALVPAINASTLNIAERMWKDDTVRAAVVAQAQARASAHPNGQSLDRAANDVDKVVKVGIPMGWTGAAVPHGAGGIALSVAGWIVTILAISLGAPFWFDTLSRLSRLRSSGKPETPLPAADSGKANERILTPPQTPPT